MKANNKVSDKEGNTPLHIAMKNNNKEIISLLLSKSNESAFKLKNPRSTRSIDVMTKYSMSHKRSIKNETSSNKRYNPQNLGEVSKKLLKYKQFSGMLYKNKSQSKNYSMTSEFRNQKYSRVDDKSPLANITQDLKSQRNPSPLSGLLYSYKTKRVPKNQLYKGNTALLRGIESVVPSTSAYRQDQISAATPNKSKLPLHMSKGPSDIIKFLENTSKTSSINSPVLSNRNALKDKDTFKTVSYSDSATKKYRSEFMNYVQPISDVSPER